MCTQTGNLIPTTLRRSHIHMYCKNSRYLRPDLYVQRATTERDAAIESAIGGRGRGGENETVRLHAYAQGGCRPLIITPYDILLVIILELPSLPHLGFLIWIVIGPTPPSTPGFTYVCTYNSTVR